MFGFCAKLKDSFVFEKLALANGHSYLNSSIKKFGCFVTRNTLNLRYFFGPENKK